MAAESARMVVQSLSQKIVFIIQDYNYLAEFFKDR